MLTELSFENYKAFRGSHSIEIRPLTILIGRNSAGKSAIARLPLLIARSLSDHVEGVVDLRFGHLDFGHSFLDLIHCRHPHGSISLGATLIEGLKFTVKLQYYDEYKFPVVDYCALFSMKNKKQIEKIEFKRIENSDPRERKYEMIRGASRQEVHLDFRGLLPTFRFLRLAKGERLNLMSTYGEEWAFPVFFSLPRFFDAITYLGPFREKPERIYIAPVDDTSDIGMGGIKTPLLLANDLLRRKGKLIEKVGIWFKDHLGGWRLDIQAISPEIFSIVLVKDGVTINIADAGAGIAQVLPVVVQRQWALMSGEDEERLEIVEQPELHLHPGAHGEVADLYITALKSHTRFLIETHSENFLLRIRRRIAEDKLNPQEVIIYWINDDPSEGERIQPIYIDERGEVDKWPRGVFSEDFHEVRAIRKAQQLLDEKKQ